MTDTIDVPSSQDELIDELRAWLEANWDPDLTVARVVAAPRCCRLGGAAPADQRLRQRACRATTPCGCRRRSPSSARWARRPASGCCSPRRPSPRTARRSRSTSTSATSSPARRRGASCSASPVPAPTSPGSPPVRCRTATSGSSTARRCGPQRGQIADLGMLIARTNPDVPKHQGITWFAIDMHQPGVEVRRLREMTGHAHVQRGVPQRRRGSTTRPSSAAATTAGPSPTPRSCTSARASAPAAASAGPGAGAAGHGRRPARPAGRRLRPKEGRPRRRAGGGSGGMFGGEQQAAHRPGQGQRHCAGPHHPPGPRAPAHDGRARPLQPAPAQGGQGRRPGHPRHAEHRPSWR